MSVRGVLLGAMSLALLQMLVSNPARADRVGALGGYASGAIAWLLSPAAAGIPDRRKEATTPPPSSTTAPAGAYPQPSDVAGAALGRSTGGVRAV